MNNYGAILDDFGFTECMARLVAECMNPISAALFPHIGNRLDSHHAFVVDYEVSEARQRAGGRSRSDLVRMVWCVVSWRVLAVKMGKDTKLDFHVDDSEVTLNLCLGRNFKGGDLFFGGVRCRHHTVRDTVARCGPVAHSRDRTRQARCPTSHSTSSTGSARLWCTWASTDTWQSPSRKAVGPISSCGQCSRRGMPIQAPKESANVQVSIFRVETGESGIGPRMSRMVWRAQRVSTIPATIKP